MKQSFSKSKQRTRTSQELSFLPFTLIRKGKNLEKTIKKLKIANIIIVKNQDILKLWYLHSYSLCMQDVLNYTNFHYNCNYYITAVVHVCLKSLICLFLADFCWKNFTAYCCCELLLLIYLEITRKCSATSGNFFFFFFNKK